MNELQLVFPLFIYKFLYGCKANVGSLSIGCGIGWLSPALGILQSDESPLDVGAINVDEASWLGGIFNIGGLVGVILLSWCRSRFGGKMAICFSAVPIIVRTEHPIPSF